MAQVVLENIYKSFPSRKGEGKPTQPQSSVQSGVSADITSHSPDNRTGSSAKEAVNVLRRINLTVEDGEFMVLVGPSGCGKSTLLRLIAGLETITGGNIWLGDKLINQLPPKQRDIAMVFQSYALYPHLTVYDNIAFGLRRCSSSTDTNLVTVSDRQQFASKLEDLLVGITRQFPKGLRYFSQKELKVHQRVGNVAQLLQIEALLNRLPKELSGGQRQRVALGRAIARNPQVFLMDEPLSNLDAKLRAETRSQIVKLQRQLGTTTIYVTHDQTEAMTMGDRIAILDRGQLQQVAPPLELYNCPANRFVAEFIGSPPMNFILVKFSAPQQITNGDFRMTLTEDWANALQKYEGCWLILGIRPEHLVLGVPATKNLPVKVELIENLGNDSYLGTQLVIPNFEARDRIRPSIQIRIPSERHVRLGEEIWLSLTPDKLHFFDPDTEAAIFPKTPINLPFEKSR